MVRRVIVVLTAVMALLAGPLSVTYAGGMGIGTGGAYVCYLSSGGTPGGSINLSDDLSFDGRATKLGVVRMVCTPVNGSGYTGAKNADPPAPCDPAHPEIACADHLKCYNIRSSTGDNAAATLTLSDFFNVETVGVGGAQVLCVGAEVLVVP